MLLHMLRLSQGPAAEAYRYTPAMGSNIEAGEQE